MKNIVRYHQGRILFMGQDTPANYKQEFCARTKRLRLRAGFSNRTEFAGFLKVSPENYAKYETRTPLPHHLVTDFCVITKTHPWELFSERPIPKAFSASGLNKQLLETILEGVERSKVTMGTDGFLNEAALVADLYSAAIEDETSTITPTQVLSILRMAGRIKKTPGEN